MKKHNVRQHYIPQFILRNFCDEEDYLWIVDAKTREKSCELVRDVFMEEHFYRDSINHKDDPNIIEKDLAIYEREMAWLIKKILGHADVVLSQEESDALKLFVAIMGLRSKHARDAFADHSEGDMIEFYSFYQEDGNLETLWKRNLGEIVKCRSLMDVLHNPHIDDPFKLFMKRDTEGFFGKFFKLAKSNGNKRFVLSDAYPAVVEGIGDTIKLDMYSIIPIASDTILLMVARGQEGVRYPWEALRKAFFMPPRTDTEGNVYLHAKEMNDDEIDEINRNIIGAATRWYVE